MAFNALLWSFAKKDNSTKRPVTSDARTVTCVTNDDFDLVNPVLLFNFSGGASNPSNYNYCYVGEFKRYYWIDSWTFVGGQWAANCSVDVLASWKNELGNHTLYVLRSASDYDGSINDTTYISKSSVNLDKQLGTSPWVTDSMDNGSFIIGIAGQATDYYCMSKSQMNYFFNYLLSNVYASEVIGELALALFESTKMLVDPLQYITQVMWLPFSIAALAQSTSLASVDKIKVGYVEVPAVAYHVVGSGVVAGLSSFTLHQHPQAATRGSYLNGGPYSYYSLNYPPFGTIELDPMVCANVDTIKADWIVDMRTGGAKMNIIGAASGSDAKVLSVVHSQVGVPYQISQVINSGVNRAEIIAQAAGMAAKTAMANSVSMDTGMSALGMIRDSIAGRIPSVTSVGAPGGIESLRGPVMMMYEFYLLVDEDLPDRGRPLCQRRKINTLSGFILVQDADVALSSTKAEQDAVRAFMEGGFFYE